MDASHFLTSRADCNRGTTNDGSKVCSVDEIT